MCYWVFVFSFFFFPDQFIDRIDGGNVYMYFLVTFATGKNTQNYIIVSTYGLSIGIYSVWNLSTSIKFVF